MIGVIFVWILSGFYIPGKGLSYVVFFGDKQSPVISELKNVDYYTHNNWGYDGQFYAQLAIDPTLRNPELRESIDSLPYRGRRILMSGISYLVGGGEPERILHIYTLLNPIAWFGLAILLLYWFPPNSWSNWFRWAGVLFSAGMWASTLRALTDGPSLLLVALGVFFIEKNKPFFAAVLLSLSGLAKETNLLGGSIFTHRESLLTPRKWPSLIFYGILLVAPLALWLLYVKRTVGLDQSSGINNFNWPLLSWGKQVVVLWSKAFPASGSGFTRPPLFCLLGIFALAVQLAYLVLRPQWKHTWWRVGAAFALLMVILGDAVWEGVASVAAFRVLLPMQLAFNVLVPYTRRWLPVLILGNLSLLTDIPPVFNSPSTLYRSKSPPQSSLAAPSIGSESLIRTEFSSEWYGLERNEKDYWQWSSGSAQVVFVNAIQCPVVVDIEFKIYSLNERDLIILGPDENPLWQEGNLKQSRNVKLKSVRLNPGVNTVKFETTTASSLAPPDPRELAFCLLNYRVSAPSLDFDK